MNCWADDFVLGGYYMAAIRSIRRIYMYVYMYASYILYVPGTWIAGIVHTVWTDILLLYPGYMKPIFELRTKAQTSYKYICTMYVYTDVCLQCCYIYGGSSIKNVVLGIVPHQVILYLVLSIRIPWYYVRRRGCHAFSGNIRGVCVRQIKPFRRHPVHPPSDRADSSS